MTGNPTTVVLYHHKTRSLDQVVIFDDRIKAERFIKRLDALWSLVGWKRYDAYIRDTQPHAAAAYETIIQALDYDTRAELRKESA